MNKTNTEISRLTINNVENCSNALFTSFSNNNWQLANWENYKGHAVLGLPTSGTFMCCLYFLADGTICNISWLGLVDMANPQNLPTRYIQFGPVNAYNYNENKIQSFILQYGQISYASMWRLYKADQFATNYSEVLENEVVVYYKQLT